MSQEPEEVKPKININIQTDDGTKITVLVRRDTKFSKVFQAAEKKFGKESGTFKFTYEGKRIQKDETPAEVDMEDGDTIDAHLGQVGGGHQWYL
ncbi:ubiquitin-related domain-containing protein [Desarmillaria ectypa]|nr:ubiquitin-related domain-containing protein [Desarmillaria ectypa]